MERSALATVRVVVACKCVMGGEATLEWALRSSGLVRAPGALCWSRRDTRGERGCGGACSRGCGGACSRGCGGRGVGWRGRRCKAWCWARRDTRGKRGYDGANFARVWRILLARGWREQCGMAGTAVLRMVRGIGALSAGWRRAQARAGARLAQSRSGPCAGHGEIPAASAGMTELARAGMAELFARVWRSCLRGCGGVVCAGDWVVARGQRRQPCLGMRGSSQSSSASWLRVCM